MSSLTYCLVVTGPHYGTEQSSSAYLFANALLEKGHQITQIFFYREGVVNANKLVSPANDEFDLPKAWIALAKKHQIPLHVCVVPRYVEELLMRIRQKSRELIIIIWQRNLNSVGWVRLLKRC